MFAWAGNILNVDLTEEKTWKEPLTKELCMNFLGGRGINAKLLWNLVKEDADPLGPENKLIFGSGPLTCTTAPCSGRTTITCKSPETNLYLKTSMGGHWGAELKFAGYDHLILHGRSKKPVYLWIKDKDVEIRDATHLWGLDVRSTDEILKEDLNDKDVEVACIGPSGEKRVRISAIMCSIYHAAARGGAGAVMGSKKVKAIAVRGTGHIEVADPDAFNDIVAQVREALRKDTATSGLHLYGTSGGINRSNDMYRLPSFNFRYSHIEDSYPISGQCLVDRGYVKRRVACFGCIIGCHRYVTIDQGKYAGTYTGGPEYETFASLGSGTGVINTEDVIKAAELCNLMGLDTISTGNAIQWAIEMYERGILSKEDTDGIELKFGNAEVLVKLILMIAQRTGKIGNLLAEGVRRAADQVGKDSWKWAICNSKGLGQSGVSTRASKGCALAFAVNPRGGDHLHTNLASAEKGATPESIELIKRITGDKKWATPYRTEYRPEIVRWHEACYAITESLGLCVFASTSAYGVNPRNMAEMFFTASGIEVDEKSMMLTGRRILTLERCYNVRLGLNRKMDDLPWRLMNEPLKEGLAKGLVNSPEELDGMLDKYYRMHNWDLSTGWPYEETLRLLGLEDVYHYLKTMGRTPE